MPRNPEPVERVERDGLGELTVPAAALYGIQTARAVRTLQFSRRNLGSCAPYVSALLMVKRAAARANRAAAVIDTSVADAIEDAVTTLLEMLAASEPTWQLHFPADLLGGGGSIGVHMNVNEVIANCANARLGYACGSYHPVHPLRHVSASQSTADVCHTALRLAILRSAAPLLDALDSTVTALEQQANVLREVPTLARTCLQDALATDLGVLFGGYAALLRRRALELRHSLGTLTAIALGGTVIGSGDGAPAAYRQRIVEELSAVSGFTLTKRNDPRDALQNSDDTGAISAQMALLARALIKIAQDLRLLASGPRGGFGEIRLPHVQQGSSFFADKRNPAVPETVLQCAFQVLGCDRTVQAALEHSELYLNIFDGLAAVNVLEAIEMSTAAVRHFDTDCVRGLEPDVDRCRALAAFAPTR